MTIQELFKNHVEIKCKGCKIEKCNGITLTIDGKTKCSKED